MKNLKLTICGADHLVEKVREAKPDLVISFDYPTFVREDQITTPRLSEELADPQNPSYSKALGQDMFWVQNQYFIEAFDVEETEPYRGSDQIFMSPPTSSQIQDAIAFFNSRAPQNRTPTIVINCAVGQSRSTALGLILLAMTHPDEDPNVLVNEILRQRPMAAPNRAIVAQGDILLKRGGSLLKAIDLSPEILDNRHCIDRTPPKPTDFWQQQVKLPRCDQ